MSYLDKYNLYKRNFDARPTPVFLGDELRLIGLDFVSDFQICPDWSLEEPPAPLLKELPEGTDLSSLFALADKDILENKSFKYFLIGRDGGDLGPKSARAVILLHGLNEKKWDKYLPMAARLASGLDAQVVLFPLAFHMNRAPELWSNTRIMGKVSKWRESLHPHLIGSSLSNAAISYRIQQNPSRFFYSGLESYQNVLELLRRIRADEHPFIAADAQIDFFTYSIGSFLGEILFLTNQDNLFDESRLIAFCGGPVFNRLAAVSKFIIDSEAEVALYSFLIEHLESRSRSDELLRTLLNRPGVGSNFKAMLNYRLDREYREERFKALSNRLLALTLTKDDVVPPYEATATFQGARGDIPVKVAEFDPPYPYRHEDPFPVSQKYASQIDEWFDRIFAEAIAFLR
ncbi:MAG: DUF6051 family protein [Deltaproteobacteria bacterium]|jgi:hypothetical protein|nr:DUF6051 family protein [Deltaproteobacteria bacterium]